MPVVLNLCIPVPADSSPGSIMTTADQIEKVLSDRTSAIVVAHLGGHPADMDPILDLATARGIPVTRLWYIREVDPYEKVLTGMTRDGTFLVEGGRVVGGLRNFRFNQGVLEMLSNVEALGPAVRSAGEESFEMVVPAMKIRGFRFSEVTKF